MNITLGRFDIQPGVNAAPLVYCVAPREGHLELLKRVYGYTQRVHDGSIRFCINIQDHKSQGMYTMQYFCISTFYGNTSKEELPLNMPNHIGKFLRMTNYQDTNI